MNPLSGDFISTMGNNGRLHTTKYSRHHLLALKTSLAVKTGALAFGLLTASQSVAFDFSGFATLGAGKINRDNISIVDYTDNWSIRSDTLVGLQAQHRFLDHYSITGQIISRGFSHTHTESFEPKFEWFFLSYTPSDAFRLRIGRLRSPMHMFSDSLAVGYAQIWARPPLDVYLPIFDALTNLDGIDISIPGNLFDHDIHWSFTIGRVDDSGQDTRITASPFLGLTAQLEQDDSLFRFSLALSRTDLNAPLIDFIADSFRPFIALDDSFTEIVESHRSEDTWIRYYSLGYQRYFEDWTLITELNYADSDGQNFNRSGHGWYVSLSHPFGTITPYGILSYSKNDFPPELPFLVRQSQSVVTPGIFPTLDTLRDSAILVYDYFNSSGYSLALGARYDFHAQAALKFELQYWESGTRQNVIVFGTELDDALMASVLIDVVF